MPETILEQLLNLVSGIILLLVVAVIVGMIGWMIILWLKWRDREEKSLIQFNLLVAVPL